MSCDFTVLKMAFSVMQSRTAMLHLCYLCVHEDVASAVRGCVAYVAGRTSAEPTHPRLRHGTHTHGPFRACVILVMRFPQVVAVFCGRGRASLRSSASAGVPMAAAPGRAPARPLAEKQNWASVCVSWEPLLSC